MYARNTSVLSTFIGAALIASISLAASAEPKAPAKPTPATKADDKVDISDLENKYWAPKDTDFSVVQNRTYSKDNRWFGTLHYGLPINDSYSEGSVLGVTGNYFFSERYGVQLTYLKANMKNKQSTNDLVNYGAQGVQPDFGRLYSYYGLGFDWVPFYAKMSFLGKKIIYFDMAITPTVGMTTYEQIVEGGNTKKSAFTYGVDVTQYFFFTNYFAVRADLKNQWYTQEVVKYRGTTKGQKVLDRGIHESLFLLGLTFFY